MKMLYVGGGHFLQSTDDCIMWAKLGIEWYDTSYYFLKNEGDCGKIEPFFGGEEFTTKLLEQHPTRINVDEVLNQKDIQFAGQIANNLWGFSREFISQFDIIFFNHFIENVGNNWDVIKDKKVIFKTFGMHPIQWEQKIKKMRAQGVYVVRNNPTEHLRLLMNLAPQIFSYNQLSGTNYNVWNKKNLYAGHDAIIRSSIIPNEEVIGGWQGNIKEVVTFANHFNYKDGNIQKRKEHYLKIKDLINYPCKLYGSGNEIGPSCGGFISNGEKIEVLKQARVALVIGTPGSAHTYSLIEALVMGTPIVTFNKMMWQSEIYDVDQIIKDGVSGFICGSVEEAAQRINLLMENDSLAKQISEAGRKLGIELYGRENRAKDWRQFLFRDIWQPKSKQAIKVSRGSDICSLDGSPNPKQRVSAIIGLGR